jgi:uncharacterized RDD family membrane protein YckC
MDYNLELQKRNENQIEVLKHPWRRFFARGFDLSIYELIWMAFQLLVLRWQPEQKFYIIMFVQIITFTMMLFIEPFMLATWGNTPGKLIFGLELKNSEGNKFTYKEAFTRTFLVIFYGYGLGIPVYNLVRLYKCRTASLDCETMAWDNEFNSKYNLKDLKGKRIILFILLSILIGVISYYCGMQSKLPLNRGELTKEEYIENINEIANRGGLGIGYKLDKNAEWKEIESDSGDRFFIGSRPGEHIILLEDGIVKGIQIKYDTTQRFISNIQMEKLYVIAGLVWSQKEINCFNINSKTKLINIIDNTENFNEEIFGAKITQKIEQIGYTGTKSMFFSTKDEEHRFKMIFTVELIN